MQIYDRGAVHIGALDTCLAVPPLLAAFYVTLGALQILVDQYRSDDGPTQVALRRATWPTLALNLGCDQSLEKHSCSATTGGALNETVPLAVLHNR